MNLSRLSLYKALVLFFALGVAMPMSAQFKSDGLWVKVVGKVTDRKNGNNLHDVQVTVRNNVTGEEETVVSKRGRYKVKLDLNFEFDLIYSKIGYTTKYVRVDTRNVPEAAAESGLKMFIDMSLFERKEDFDESVFDEPIGIARFKYGVGMMSWDVEYSRERFHEIENEHKRSRGEIVQEDIESKPSPHPCKDLPSTVDYTHFIIHRLDPGEWYPVDKFRAYDNKANLLLGIGLKFMDASTLARQGDATNLISTVIQLKKMTDSLHLDVLDGEGWSGEIAEDLEDTSALVHWVDEYYHDFEQGLLVHHDTNYVRIIRFGLILEGLRTGLREKDSSNVDLLLKWVAAHTPVMKTMFADFNQFGASDKVNLILNEIYNEITSLPGPKEASGDELSFSMMEANPQLKGVDPRVLHNLQGSLNNFYNLVMRGE